MNRRELLRLLAGAAASPYVRGRAGPVPIHELVDVKITLTPVRSISYEAILATLLVSWEQQYGQRPAADSMDMYFLEALAGYAVVMNYGGAYDVAIPKG
jgi:hypothetical protein